MGYTHYYEANRPLDGDERRNLGDAIERIVETTDVPLAGWDGTGEVKFSGQGVTLNGVDDDGHETFTFPVGENFNFCKTAYKPYDEVVTAILIAADTLCPGAFRISSDGNAEEWSPGLELARRALNRTDLKVPDGV